MNLYNIYCPERRMFWKPNSIGYTAVQSEAGIYSEDEADDICHQPNVADRKVPVDVEMKPTWIEVESYKDVPEGTWLVKVETSREDSNPYHVMVQSGTLAVIGQHFAFDMSRVLAYRKLGELL